MKRIYLMASVPPKNPKKSQKKEPPRLSPGAKRLIAKGAGARASAAAAEAKLLEERVLRLAKELAKVELVRKALLDDLASARAAQLVAEEERAALAEVGAFLEEA